MNAAVADVAIAAKTAEQKKQEEAKAAKEAAKKAKEEERLKLAAKKEAEEKAAQEEHERLVALAVTGKEAAASAYGCGKKGTQLADYVSAMEVKPTGAGLISCIMEDAGRSPNPRVWLSKAEYGPAMSFLLKDADIKLQVLALLEVEKNCGENDFPMYSPGAGKKDLNLIEVIFQAMLENELADPDAFNAWVDEEKLATKYRNRALIKTVGFMTWLNEPDEPDSDEEEEDFDVDAVRATVS